MPVKISDELKTAILDMPEKKRNQLLIRLVKKDPKLLDKLHYQLLEGEEDKEKRKRSIETELQHYIDIYPQHYESPQYLLYAFKDISGRINYYQYITGDKVAVVEYNFAMLRELLLINESRLEEDYYYRGYSKLARYTIQRLVKIIKMCHKLHADYLLEFEDDLIALGQYISRRKYYFQSYAAEYQLDYHAMAEGIFPEFE